jgi:hypothetical protein
MAHQNNVILLLDNNALFLLANIASQRIAICLKEEKKLIIALPIPFFSDDTQALSHFVTNRPIRTDTSPWGYFWLHIVLRKGTSGHQGTRAAPLSNGDPRQWPFGARGFCSKAAFVAWWPTIAV